MKLLTPNNRTEEKILKRMAHYFKTIRFQSGNSMDFFAYPIIIEKSYDNPKYPTKPKKCMFCGWFLLYKTYDVEGGIIDVEEFYIKEADPNIEYVFDFLEWKKKLWVEFMDKFDNSVESITN